ncbi:glycosyltransferase family 2 protein [Thermosynechococcus sp. GLH187]|uniref:glycosyltransferase family 2 protein n=1 Tax=unclassified Thermosynechococcus TaxID=2622553 RepID=UPI0028774489|nr:MULTISPECIES: glycosyltransferase family 2 protein [unclassified Thermosynechococcus]WNC45866.1 glycosyltransferase family 2 protein [Thermosynechococcus sp. GLH187]WNC48402.1 glycosyltransferase family 2 protein [Thermosynechococcus sp. GLH333]WNC50935.1 glycosyltransferase family 2 protein [Thermosynechococcus sp. GLH87]
MISISVVIPLYNKAPHIDKALDSVLAQTSPPDEIIVVDDGSTDGGAELVVPYIEKHGVRLIRQANAGVSAARNCGVSESNAEYIAFLDADDFWLDKHLEMLRKLIESFPDASLLSTAYVLERGGRQYRPSSSYEDGFFGLVDDFFVRYAHGLCLIHSITACAKKRDLLEIGGFPVGVRRGEDIVCWINMALKYPVAHAEVVTAVYYQDAVNRTDHRLRETEPPGSLQHIAALLKTDWLTDEQRKGLALLFDRIAFFTAAGFRAQGDWAGLAAIRRLAWATGRYRVGMLAAALHWTPALLLRAAKTIRHPRVRRKAACVRTKAGG